MLFTYPQFLHTDNFITSSQGHHVYWLPTGLPRHLRSGSDFVEMYVGAARLKIISPKPLGWSHQNHHQVNKADVNTFPKLRAFFGGQSFVNIFPCWLIDWLIAVFFCGGDLKFAPRLVLHACETFLSKLAIQRLGQAANVMRNHLCLTGELWL